MSLTLIEAEAQFGRMLDGALSDEEITATLIDIAERGETAQELAGAAKAMRARMIRAPGLDGAIDVCGTGGDGQHSLNVSTATAIVVAACEVPVAKHGNRAASSLAGTADTLEALGLNLANAGERAEATLAEIGIAFFFAQRHHPALARIAPIRKALGRRTIFNLLGPLANPAGVRRQLVGVAHPSLIALYRDAMQLLDTEAALIVSGAEGLDELSIAGTSYMASIGLPGLANFVGEFLALVGAYKANSWVAAVATTGVILGAAYMLYLYRRVAFGTAAGEDTASMRDMTAREWLTLAPIAAATIWMGVYPESFMAPMRNDVTALLARIESVAPAGDADLKQGKAKPAATHEMAHGEAH